MVLLTGTLALPKGGMVDPLPMLREGVDKRETGVEPATLSLEG